MTLERKPPESPGFTLLELMVALALTSLLTMVAYSSLSLCIKAMGRGQASAEQLQELRVGQKILERSLASAISGTLGNRLYFLGDPRQMRFFTLVPLEAYNLGGVYHWRVLEGQDEAGNRVLAVEQTRNVNWRRDPEGVETRQILMGGLTSLRFSYGRGSEEFETWDAKAAGHLPDWVSVHFTLQGKPPMVLLIPLHLAENGNGNGRR